MKSFFLILGFFTKLPVPHVEYTEELYGRGVRLAPFVGLLMGLILYGVSLLILPLDYQATAFILTVSYLLLTGGIHLDGMADTCDGLFSGRDRERMLEIMKDSRVGTYGVISIILWFLFFFVALQHIPTIMLFIMPMVGKAAAILSAHVGGYAREDGLGKVFVNCCTANVVTISIILPTVMVAGLGFTGLLWQYNPQRWFLIFFMEIAMIFSLLMIYVISLNIKEKLGGVTGDTLGFVCEVSQMIFIAMGYVFYQYYGISII